MSYVPEQIVRRGVSGLGGSGGGPSLRMQYTVDGDGWDSLARAYNTTPSAIIQMQPQWSGKSFTRASMQAWIKSLPGWSRAAGLLPYSPSNNPGTLGPDGRPEGWATFTSQTQLLLPDMPRADGRGGVSVAAKYNTAGPGIVFALIAGAFFLSAAYNERKHA